MKLSYFPGCSLDGTAKEYGLSTEAICERLGVELVELPDWNCCGASSGHCTNRLLDQALGSRNLFIADRAGLDLVVACAACFTRFKNAAVALKEDKEFRRKMQEIMKSPYKGNFEIKHLLDVVCNTIGLATIKENIRKPLKGLKAVAYYGCVIVRPHELTQFDDEERPRSLDNLMEVMGTECLAWSYRTECCGASLALTTPSIVMNLCDNLVDMAKEAGADCIVTACPLCLANLDMQPTKENRMPVFYFTELLGVALGLDAVPWFRRHLTNPMPLLESLNLVSA